MGKLLKVGCLGVVALVGVVIVVVVAVSMSGGGGGTSPTDTDADGYEVVYEVTGSGGATKADMTFTTNGSGSISQETGESLPWTKRLTFDEEPFSFFSVSAQNQGGGELACTVTVNGEEVVSNTASGRFAIVSCDASSE